MKVTQNSFKSDRSSKRGAHQPEAIRPKVSSPKGIGLAKGNRVKRITVLTVIAIVLAIASVSIFLQIHSETAKQDHSAGMQLDETMIPFSESTDFSQPPILLPSPNACCATIVAEIAMR